jgi:hypothetical protein
LNSTGAKRGRRAAARFIAVATAMVTVLTTTVLAATPALAAGTFVHRNCWHTAHVITVGGAEEWANFCWGFDYGGRPPASNNLRGYARIVAWAAGADPNTIHVQADALRLGDGNGVISTRTANSQTGVLDIDTLGSADCHYQNPAANYISHLLLSVRFTDGFLYKYDAGQWQRDANGTPDGVCTNNSKDYAHAGELLPYEIDAP